MLFMRCSKINVKMYDRYHWMGVTPFLFVALSNSFNLFEWLHIVSCTKINESILKRRDLSSNFLRICTYAIDALDKLIKTNKFDRKLSVKLLLLFIYSIFWTVWNYIYLMSYRRRCKLKVFCILERDYNGTQ